MATLAPRPVEKGRSWGDITIDTAKQVRDRDICLEEVAKWRAAELQARQTGAPGT